MSGGVGAIWVDSTSTALSYGVISIFRELPGYFFAKPAAASFSPGCCSGASPAPRQQNQRSCAGLKSGMWNVCAATGGRVAGLKVFRGVGATDAPPLGVADEQAAAITTVAASNADTRWNGWRTRLASSRLIRQGLPAPGPGA